MASYGWYRKQALNVSVPLEHRRSRARSCALRVGWWHGARRSAVFELVRMRTGVSLESSHTTAEDLVRAVECLDRMKFLAWPDGLPKGYEGDARGRGSGVPWFWGWRETPESVALGAIQRRRARLALLGVPVMVLWFVVMAVRGCESGQVLVEQFDNGPVGGPVGASEGFMWVGRAAKPSPGKNWRYVDPATLTAEERRELGLDEVRGDRKRDR